MGMENHCLLNASISLPFEDDAEASTLKKRSSSLSTHPHLAFWMPDQ